MSTLPKKFVMASSISLLPSKAKKNRRLGMLGAITTLAAAMLCAPNVRAQNVDSYPNKAVRLVVPFAPGGPTDLTARILGEGLSKKWGQPVVMENRPGAGGTIGASSVAIAAPDGYTLLLGVTGSQSIAGSLYKALPYDPKNDFEPISRVVIYPNAILANPKLPANTLQELIALVQKTPDGYTYGSDGNGTASHLTMELLKEQGKFDMVAVQYKGASPMLNDLIAGFIEVGITGLPSAEAYLKSGQLKLIAITTDKDYSEQGFPTVGEQGFPGFEAAPWSGIFAPKGTPKALVEKISADIADVLSSDEIKQKMDNLGLQPMPNSSDQFSKELEAETAKWAEAVKISGAQVE